MRAPSTIIMVKENPQPYRAAIVMTCRTCSCSPCVNPDFCRACRDAHRRKARGEPLRFIEASLWRGPPDHIPQNWNEISLEALIAHFDVARSQNDAPERTVEALMWSLRTHSTKALDEAAAKRRLSELSDQQVIEVGDRLQKLKPQIARAWTTKEVKTLLRARGK